MATPFYVTTPIYYVNDAPHIGHAYTTILADVLARYHRLIGVPTFFLTGTDEHGQKVFDAALKAGISPQEQTDRTVVRFQQLWEKLEISHDDFIRTTEPRHTEVVRETLADLWERGEIYAGDYEGWYSVSEERFYTEKDLVDGKSPEGKPVEKIVEKNYFFKMSQYQGWLIQHIEENPEFIQPESRRNETLGYLRKPLGDLCISRPKARMPWGIELPFDQDYVCYVWFDALLNYITAIGYRRDEKELARWWPADFQLIGKDILATHTVYWPIMLKAMGVPLPRTVYAHGWWLTGGSKMSKSEGNAVDPMAMIDQYGVDAVRYYLMADMSLGQDATFTIEQFWKRYNSNLTNDLGNLVSRVHTMVRKNFDGVLPEPGESGEEERTLEEATRRAVEGMESHLHGMTLDRGIGEVMAAVREGNRYFDTTAPWTLVKQGDTARLATVLYSTAECLRIVSGLLFPIMPSKMVELRRAIGLTGDQLEPQLELLRKWGALEAGAKFGELTPLFPRVDRPADESETKPGKQQRESARPEKSPKKTS
ncbi:MAG: methionine--tRNA ligase, partial [Planctomycetes bacterium]|nr:methionine--tRNA ligase [Planctomycetota bacterium]